MNLTEEEIKLVTKHGVNVYYNLKGE